MKEVLFLDREKEENALIGAKEYFERIFSAKVIINGTEIENKIKKAIPFKPAILIK